MSKFKTGLDWVARSATSIACLLVIAMMLHVSADVIGRTFFHHPLPGTLEIVTAYYMVALAFLPIAWIARERGHIIVELFTAHLPRRKIKLLDAFAGIVTLGYVAMFTYQVTLVAIAKTKIGEAWESANGYVDVWPSRWVIPVGFAVMAIYVLLQIFSDLKAARTDKETSE
ncbi:TRAP transporter small permease [Mariluticola halotolerans]|uniref:TRAP transporter small permease n=1 Tax=Mariluticola halotolerans TaxID=2909283 RepID=UPI0026E40470|nr:TRAP transporter small permease [Mariluticola halotolerans]UJQ94652.1 TRAP transporter small permease [Mariluticola halotolerans]